MKNMKTNFSIYCIRTYLCHLLCDANFDYDVFLKQFLGSQT